MTVNNELSIRFLLGHIFDSNSTSAPTEYLFFEVFTRIALVSFWEKIQTRASGRWNFQSRRLVWLRESRFFGFWHQMGYALMAFGRPSL